MNTLYELRCVKCKKITDEKIGYTNCLKCGSPLEVRLNYDLLVERVDLNAIRTAPIKSTKYMDFYPIRDKRHAVTLDEGGTPLYHCQNLGKILGLSNLFVKYEGLNPTGAFKDRGTMVEITKAVEIGKKTVIVASSGNMAASVSAYCSKAKLPAYVLIPQGTPIGKMSQTLSYGARIIQIRSTYDVAARMVKEISKKHNFYLAGDYAFRLEGQKSQAYEIAEQLGWKSPDRVIVPVGCGTNGSAIWKGFKEYEYLELIDKTPKIIGVQANGADPVVQAFKKKSKNFVPINNPTTIASAICVGNPLDGIKILNAIYDSGGSAVGVDDMQILEAEKLLAKTESIFVEPASASSLAALKVMADERKIDKDETIVLVLTGTGLKDPASALRVMYSPPTVEPDIDEVEKHLNYGFYDTVASHSHTIKLLFSKKPTEKELASAIKSEFSLKLSQRDIKICMNLIDEFFEKKKEILRGDMQYIIEKAMRGGIVRNYPLRVIDFTVESKAHTISKSSVVIEYKGHRFSGSAEGVGPVDSCIKAIKSAVSQNGFKFHLVDYQVSIIEGDTKASVNVKMTFMDDKKNKIIAMGTSPDIIVASIEAFIEGYNFLWNKNKKK